MRQSSGKNRITAEKRIRTDIPGRGEKGLIRKLQEPVGETLTEVLISVLVIALGITMFLTAFLASGRMLRQGEEQMESYYDSRNQIENRQTAKKAKGTYVLELTVDGGGKKSLASNAYQTGVQTNYPTGQYPIELYVNRDDSDTENEKRQDLLYRYR